MNGDGIDVDPDHRGTFYCTECGTDIRVGKIDSDTGLFCGCTVANGRPFKGLAWGMHPWPDQWELEET